MSYRRDQNRKTRGYVDISSMVTRTLSRERVDEVLAEEFVAARKWVDLFGIAPDFPDFPSMYEEDEE